MATWNFPNLIAAIDGGKGETTRGYSFVQRDGSELQFSFDRLRTEAMNRAAHFRAWGLKQGDRLAIILPDGEDFVPTFLGAVWAGIIPVPLYPPLSLGKLDAYIDGLATIMNRAEVSALVTNAKLKQIVWSAAARVTSLKGIIDAEALSTDAPADASREPAAVRPDDTAFLQFTSGSTSLPKGVDVTHGNLRANCWAIMRDGLRSDETDVGISWLPLYHDMGLIGFVIAPLFHRVPVTFIPTLSFVRNATIWMDTISKKRGTITFAPNFAYSLVTKRAKPEQIASWDLSSMKAFGCGAEPINPRVMKTFVEKFEPAGLKPTALIPCYGMAEATLAISFIALEETLSTDVIDSSAYESAKTAEPAHESLLASHKALEFVSCGRAFPGHEVAAFGPDGEKLPERRVGELRVKGPSVAQGYFRDEVATRATFPNGWLRTGDLGYLANGNVYITGRQKDLIIINGRNYDPQRMEWLVDELPEVRKGNTVAFSRPGTASEELVVVVESKTETPDALKDAIKTRLTEQLQLAVADVVICAPGSLPKTSSGKLQRQKTRAQYLDGTLGTEGVRTLGGTGQRLTLAKHVAMSLVGRSQHRARRVIEHTAEIRSIDDAVGKMRLVSEYAISVVNRLMP